MLKKKKIALFLNVWSNELVSKVLEGIREEAKKDNADIFVFTSLAFFSDHDIQKRTQLKLFEMANPNDYDGAIMFTNTFNIPEEENAVRDSFQLANVPMISLDSRVNNMAFVGTENYNGVYELATHLVKKHDVKTVVYVAGIQGNQEDSIRKKALEDALADQNLKLFDSIRGDYGFHTAWIKTGEWIDNHDKLPDAFVCANDYTAIGVYNALFERGLEVPEDTIVTGFDHCSDGVIADPMLATVSRDGTMLGKRAYNELMNQIQNPDPTIDIILPSKFVPSESCGCEADESDAAFKKNKLRRVYLEGADSDMLEYSFKNLRLNTMKVFEKNDFYELTKNEFEMIPFTGDDFCLCAIPDYFELQEDAYLTKVSEYPQTMEVMYEKSSGRSVPSYEFDRKDIVPGYEKKENESNLYIIAPLNQMNSLIGYITIKNNTTMLYSGMLYIYCINLNDLFARIRNSVFAERNERELKKIYMSDFTTDMYNRKGCDKVLNAFLEKQKENSKPSILVLADIDCMKAINEKFGMIKGDMTIKATAEALKKFLPEEWLFARFSGDEFVMVGEYLKNMNYEDLKKTLREKMTQYFEQLDLGFPLSVSVGYVYINPRDDRNMDEFVKIANDAMYKEKQEAHVRLKDLLNE